MHTHAGLPVAGYRPQSQTTVDIVNEHKTQEELLLRRLDRFKLNGDVDQRWLAVARTHFEEGFMALNRAVFKPARINLPEDDNRLHSEA